MLVEVEVDVEIGGVVSTKDNGVYLRYRRQACGYMEVGLVFVEPRALLQPVALFCV